MHEPLVSRASGARGLGPAADAVLASAGPRRISRMMRAVMHGRLCSWGAALACLAPAAGTAAQAPLALTPMQVGHIRVDGDVGEWRGPRWSELGDQEAGAMEHALAFDADAVYVAARVWDDDLVRTRAPGPREDAVVLTLALPDADGDWRTTEVWLFAGLVGRIPGAGGLGPPGRPSVSRAIQVVEGPLDRGKGYVLEARIPLRSLAGGRDWMLGRGALRLHDVDGRVGAPARDLATTRADPARPSALPPLLADGGPNTTLADFLRQKQMAGSDRELLGDVTGDARLERVAFAGTFAVVVGPDIDAGRGFRFVDLPVTTSAGVRDAQLRDVTGDAKAELLVTLRQKNDLGSRDLWRIVDLTKAQPKPIFGLEVRKETGDGVVESTLEVARGARGGAPEIETRIGVARGLGPDNYAEGTPADVQPILLPWGPVARRVYQWDGMRFAVIDETPNPAAKAASVKAGATGVVSAGRASAAPVTPGPVRTYAEPPSAAELIQAFREAQGIDASVPPRFTIHVNVAEDKRVESVMLFGAHLLILGEGFQGGTGWCWFGLPVHDGADVQRVFSADVTGDGRREVFVRIKQLIGDVQREILLGYTFEGEGLRRILGVEVRRAQAGHSVGNVVRVVPDGKQWALRIYPGGATAWDARSYPFVAEQTDQWGPLLLPWKDATLQYRYDGRVLVPAR